MQPTVRRDHNVLYRGPSPEIGDLSCRRERPGVIVSHWRPTAAELDALNAGGSVRVAIWSEPIPPLAVSVETTEDDTRPALGPACPNCGQRESYLAAVRGPRNEEFRHCTECRKVFARSRESADRKDSA